MHAINTKIGLGFTTAMAAALLVGCATGPAPRAEASASAAQRDMARGEHDRAIQHAEAAVAAAPHNGQYRMVLGEAYLDAGRFASAEASFADAMTLGEESPRAALSLALAQIAQAKYPAAVSLLSEWEERIATADVGLAFALAGQPERGIHLMSNAIRSGENTVKMRQNLAYSYAMAGRWREARLMAQQDVPAGEINHRLEQWASMAPYGAYRARVAALLGVPATATDSGQPQHLALSNNPSVEQLAAEATSQPAPRAALASAELPALNVASSVPQAASALPAAATPTPRQSVANAFASAPDAQAVAPGEQRQFVSNPVVQPIAARTASAASSRSTAALPASGQAGVPAAEGTHLVQLGSFLSEQGARRAWSIYASRYPELANREMVITQANVRGRNYWRVSAGGFDQNASRNMCGQVRSSGQSCITWALGRPLPGAVDSGVRLARR